MTRLRLFAAGVLAALALPVGVAHADTSTGWCPAPARLEVHQQPWGSTAACIRAPYNRTPPPSAPVVETVGYWDWKADVYVRVPAAECASIPMCGGVGLESWATRVFGLFAG